MKYCTKCGNEMLDEAVVCVKCGCMATPVQQQQTAVQPQPSPADQKSFGFATLCFFFPVIGLILYLVWKKEFPLKAGSCGKGALIGLIVSIVLYVVMIVLTTVLAVMYPKYFEYYYY